LPTLKQKGLSLLSLLLLLPGLSVAAPPGWAPLLEPQQLASILRANPEVRVLQVSGNYQSGHIPGSVASAYGDWRGDETNPGALPDLEHFTGLLQSLGISAQTPVTVVHEGASATDMGTATRVYWTLKSLGVVDIAVLNGGLNAWRMAGLPLSADATVLPASNFQPQWQHQWRVTTSEVEATLQSGEMQLIDARPLSFYRGYRATIARPGTISGAANLEYESWFDEGTLKPESQLQSIANQFGQLEAPVTVSFCNTGHWASINWFVMSEVAGIDNVKLYAESVAEWSLQGLPLENQPSRGQIYREQTVSWLRDLFGR